MQIQLTWTELDGTQRQPVLATPVAFGSEINAMPETFNGKRVSRMVLADSSVAAFHAIIDDLGGELTAINRNSNRDLLINGVRAFNGRLIDGDRLQIGTYEIRVKILASQPTSSGANWECDRMVGFLFKRRCGRTSQIGCEYCQSDSGDPYFSERSYYPNYGRYRSSSWSSNSSNDFTEADSTALGGEADADFEFERDMEAS